MALAQAAEMAGIDRKRLHDRLERGFSTRDAFERPVEGGMRYITWKGEEHNIAVWARKLKISYQTLHSRIYKMGWDVDRAFSTPSAKTGK
jgi:DNA-binding NtrC family response regulator